MRTRIIGTGAYSPERVLTNADLERMVETTDEWIRTRTGIRERHMLAPGEDTSDMAAEAARRALAAASVRADEVDLVVCGTVTPDTVFPSTACWLQKKIGVREIPSFDVSAACSGFLYGLAVADGLLMRGAYRTALVIGCDALSRFTDYEDRSTCVLFGDGAGAAVLRAEPGERGLLYTHLGADGWRAHLLGIPAGGARRPATAETVAERAHYIRMNGREIFKFGVQKAVELVRDAAEHVGCRIGEIAEIIPHQVNVRILKAAADRLGIPVERFYSHIERYGNTSAASVPVALDEAVRTGRVREGDLVCLIAFGAGLTWASALVRW